MEIQMEKSSITGSLTGVMDLILACLNQDPKTLTTIYAVPGNHWQSVTIAVNARHKLLTHILFLLPSLPQSDIFMEYSLQSPAIGELLCFMQTLHPMSISLDFFIHPLLLPTSACIPMVQNKTGTASPQTSRQLGFMEMEVSLPPSHSILQCQIKTHRGLHQL